VLNKAHGLCLEIKEGAPKQPSAYFSDDLDEEIKNIEAAVNGLDLIHSFMVNEMVALLGTEVK